MHSLPKAVAFTCLTSLASASPTNAAKAPQDLTKAHHDVRSIKGPLPFLPLGTEHSAYFERRDTPIGPVCFDRDDIPVVEDCQRVRETMRTVGQIDVEPDNCFTEVYGSCKGYVCVGVLQPVLYFQGHNVSGFLDEVNSHRLTNSNQCGEVYTEDFPGAGYTWVIGLESSGDVLPPYPPA